MGHRILRLIPLALLLSACAPAPDAVVASAEIPHEAVPCADCHVGELLENATDEGVVDPPAPPLRRHDTCVTQDTEVVRQQARRDLRCGSQLTRTAGSATELSHHPPADGITQRLEQFNGC